MDPLACWRRLCEACACGDMEEAADAADELNTWRRSGGFRPDAIPRDVWRMGQLRDFARLCRLMPNRPVNDDPGYLPGGSYGD